MRSRINMKHFKVIEDQKADLNILFAGDLCPMYQIEQACKNDAHSKISNKFKKHFENKDLFVANLESPLTKSDKKRNKYVSNVKADPVSFKIVQECNIDILSLANNHIMEYGSTGFKIRLN